MGSVSDGPRLDEPKLMPKSPVAHDIEFATSACTTLTSAASPLELAKRCAPNNRGVTPLTAALGPPLPPPAAPAPEPPPAAPAVEAATDAATEAAADAANVVAITVEIVTDIV